ncbi:uncharacterized protein DS421_11g341070 [Arachis hypogaea]|nr:uncharacterized protein DS421_11g341070 [Arachis hypogaea]
MRKKGKKPVALPIMEPTTRALRPYFMDRPSDNPDILINQRTEFRYGKFEKRPIHWERTLKVPIKYKTVIHERIASLHWEFLEQDPIEVNETMVREFYANYQNWEAESVFLRDKRLDTSNRAIEAILKISHISPENDDYSRIKVSVSKERMSLTPILERIGRPGASWEYSKGRNSIPATIAYSNLNAKARIWHQIVEDYIIPSTHATHVRFKTALLLWAIMEGKSIAIVPLFRTSIWKLIEKKNINIPFSIDGDAFGNSSGG